MATWQSDVKSAQQDFQKELKKTSDKNAQQALVQKYNTKLNQQRIALFSPLEKDILAKTQAVQKEKGLDYVRSSRAPSSSVRPRTSPKTSLLN